MLNKISQYILLLLCLCFVTSIHAQTLNVSNESLMHDEITRNAIKVVIAPQSKEVKKEFKDYMDDRHEVKVEGIGFLKNKDVLYTEQQLIPAIASQEVQLFARIVENNENTEMYVFGQFDNNKQISSSTTYAAYAGMKDVTMDFLRTILPDYYENMVEEQNDTVEDLEDHLADVRKQLKKNKEEIEELTKENKELEQELATSEVKLKQNKDKLSKKRASLKKVNQSLEKE